MNESNNWQNWSFASEASYRTYHILFEEIKGLSVDKIPDYVFKVILEKQTRYTLELLDYEEVNIGYIKNIYSENYFFDQEFTMQIYTHFGDYIRIYTDNVEIRKKANRIFHTRRGVTVTEGLDSDYIWSFQNPIHSEGEEYLYIWFLLTIVKDIVKETMGYIYIIKNNDQYKIGKTIDFANRYKTYQRTENPYPYETILCENVFDYSNLEKQLHKQFADKNTRGEWFALSREEVDEVKAIINSNKI